VNARSPWLRATLTWAELLPALRSALWVVLLFGAGLWAAHEFALPIERALSTHPVLGLVAFVASSALAVVLPVASNLPLVPLVVPSWGPLATAALLLLGWILGSAASFVLARRARQWIVRRFPAVQRHADIERLIHPRHRLASLVSLRMTFPVDVLSYALGLFSERTTLSEVMTSTAIGAAPFALVFAWFPTWSAQAQGLVFAASLALFGVHLLWVLRPQRDATGR